MRSLVQQEAAGVISLTTFVELFELLNTPDADYKIAFRLADKNKNGIITKEEFQRVLSSLPGDQTKKFNWSSDWVNLFFGKEGTGQLTFSEFSQLLEGSFLFLLTLFLPILLLGFILSFFFFHVIVSSPELYQFPSRTVLFLSVLDLFYFCGTPLFPRKEETHM